MGPRRFELRTSRLSAERSARLSYEPIPFLHSYIIYVEQKKFYLRTYKIGMEIVVALCDRELIGRTFREGEISLEVSPAFYKGDLASEKEALNALKRATVANIVGESAVRFAIEKGFVEPSNVLRVRGIPHAQIVWL